MASMRSAGARVAALLAAACMVFALAGCSAVGTTGSDTAQGEAAQDATESAEVSSAGSGEGAGMASNEAAADVAATNETAAGETATNSLETTTFEVNGAAFTMALVEAGTFTMGSNDMDVQFSESPAHEVTLSSDYLMGTTEVTRDLWDAVMEGAATGSTLPKTSVTWSEAHDFIDRLNEMAHERGLIAAERDFHLPTEAQWEFAAKGGNLSSGYLYAGSNDIDEVAVTRENSGSDAPIEVATKAPNELGLYDMSGNAYEWVEDAGGDYAAEAQTDPCNSGAASGAHVKRGGSNYHSFASEPYLFTTTGRYFYASTDWTIGFRICLY